MKPFGRKVHGPYCITKADETLALRNFATSAILHPRGGGKCIA
jgi:hypothetical protein